MTVMCVFVVLELGLLWALRQSVSQSWHEITHIFCARRHVTRRSCEQLTPGACRALRSVHTCARAGVCESERANWSRAYAQALIHAGQANSSGHLAAVSSPALVRQLALVSLAPPATSVARLSCLTWRT